MCAGNYVSSYVPNLEKALLIFPKYRNCKAIFFYQQGLWITLWKSKVQKQKKLVLVRL